METTELIKTNFKVVAIDETNHWCDRLKEICGKISTVYLFDNGFVTYACEITASYYLTPLYYITENEVSDEVYEELQNTFNEVETEGKYIHVVDVNKMESVEVDQNIEVVDLDCEEYKEQFDEVEEYVKCNHQI